MRIISRFHDYYDSVQVYGIDPNVMYIRNKEELPSDSKGFESLYGLIPNFFYRNNEDSVHIDRVDLVLFCGKLYPSVMCLEDKKTKNHYSEYNSYRIYSADKLIRLFRKNGSTLFDNKSIWYGNYGEVVRKMFEHSGKTFSGAIDLHFKYKSPIIRVHRDTYKIKIELNSNLKELELFKVLDSFAAYQELSMFISGVMGGQCPPIVKVSDKIRAEKHGFDKWSFRRMPEDKK